MPARRFPLRSRWTLRLAILVAALSVFGPASAEIYGWVDTDGSFTYSNLPPPKGARVTDVIPEAPAPTRMPGSGAALQAELAAMNERIRQIEAERDLALRRTVDFPPPPQYGPVPAYAGYGCDTIDVDCGGYSVPYVVYGAAPVYYNNGGRYVYGARRHETFGAMSHGRMGHGGGSRPAHAALATPGHGSGRR